LLYPADAAVAFFLGANNWHLDTPLQLEHNSDLVCKVHITAVRDVGLTACNLFPGAPDVMRKAATARVVSVVRGDCGDTIEIGFDWPQDGDAQWGMPVCQLFTELRPDETCLVFLKRFEGGCRLNRIRSKARVTPAAVPYDEGEVPLLRLLEEFLTGLDSDDPMVRLQAVEELGEIGDTLMKELGPFAEPNDPSARIASSLRRAQQVIRRARSDENLVVRSVALMVSFQLGDPPNLDQTRQLLLTDPGRFGPADSVDEYGINDFCVAARQKRLLATMDATTRRALKDLENGSTIRRPAGHGIYRGVPGFPYAQFFKWALRTEAVARSAEMRGRIANVIWIRYERASVPEMIHLLDDPEIAIRRTAASALNKCIRGNFTNAWDRSSFYASPVGEGSGQVPEKPLEERLNDYEQNEQEYLRFWKDWWQQNKTRFDIDAEDLQTVS
jgi:hypothetical protein